MRYILVLIFLVQNCYCKSQSILDSIIITTHEPIPTELTYSFPEIVKYKLMEYAKKVDFLKSTNCLLLSKTGKYEFEIVFYSFEKSKKSDRLSEVLISTNRFTYINGSKIPIILDTDYDFGDVNQTITGYLHRILFNKKYIDGSIKYEIVNAN
jgi:hypothetical protein